MKSGEELPAAASGGGFLKETFISIVAHLVAPTMLALASAFWLYLAKDPSIPWLGLLIFVVVTISGAYLSLISVQFFFHEHVRLSRRPKVHFVLLVIVVVIVTAPLAMMQSFTRARTSELLAQRQKLEKELDGARQSQMDTDSRRIQLYVQVTDSMVQILRKPNLDSDDIYDLLHFCVESISLNKPRVHDDLRAAVAFLEREGRYLVVPTHGYYGSLDKDITGLYFDVSARRPEETEDAYRDRAGVAGWSYITRKPILDDDVQTVKPGEEHHYKRFQMQWKENRDDRSMICVGIPDLRQPENGRYVGVLSISSLSPGVFTKNDLAIARFFATLLGRSKTPVDTPTSVRKGS